MRRIFARAAIFSTGASALWALLPLIAEQGLGSGPSGFGLFVGCLGLGAILGGLFLGRVRSSFSLEAIVNGSALAFCSLAVLTVLVSGRLWVCFVLVMAGMAWMMGSALIFGLGQMSVPAWVRARATALLLVVFQGAMAFGALLWGVVAEQGGVLMALLAAAGSLLVFLLASLRWPLREQPDAVVTLAETPVVGDPREQLIITERGVDVVRHYHVKADAQAEFMGLLQARKLGLRRNGARHWALDAHGVQWEERVRYASEMERELVATRATRAEQAMDMQLMRWLT